MLFSLLLAAAPVSAQGRAELGNCAVCHGKENREFQASVHAGSVSCIDCHGGVADTLDVAQAHGTGLRALTDPLAALESCGACHSDVGRMRAFGLRTDQLSLYWTSRHGQALAADGAAGVATCISCHGVHGVLSASDPLSPISPLRQIETCGQCHADSARMTPHGLSSSTVAEFRDSVHGRALIEEGNPAAPTCSDCHGAHGATPPRFADIGQVCGQCHSTVQAFFSQSAHARSPQADVQCVTCHASHAVQEPGPEMFLGDDAGHCGSCHAAGDAGMSVAAALHRDVEKLSATIESTDLAVRTAGGHGTFLGAERGYIDEARGLLVRSRAMTHSLSPEGLEDILNRGQGMVGQTEDGLRTQRRILRDRKIYTGIFMGISLAFALVLWMYGAELRARGTRGRGGRQA